MSVELDVTNFSEVTGSGTVVVDFWATWCAPCKAIKPIIDSVEKEGVTFGTVNIATNTELAVNAQVRSVPTIVLMKDGVELARRGSFTTETELLEWIDSNLN